MTHLDSTPVNPDRLLETFLSLLRIDSPSGEESAVIQELQRRLQTLGLETVVDGAGNLIGRLAGAGEPLLLCAHVDHVEPCRGIHPVVQDGVVRSDGTTILGADDTSGAAIILELLEIARANAERGRQPPALDVVFTVGEESGLVGSKGLDLSLLRARHGVVLDMGGPRGYITVRGPSHDHLEVVIHGKKSHAACAPEAGVNAIRVAAEAIAAMPLGRIDETTTANIGVIRGGTATNVVPDRVELLGEARSLEEERLRRQVEAMLRCLEEAAGRHGARLEVHVQRKYDAFQVPADAPIVQMLCRSLRHFGVEPTLISTVGGSDSNIFNSRGLQTVNISTGMEQVHSTEEYIAVDDMAFCAAVLGHMLGL